MAAGRARNAVMAPPAGVDVYRVDAVPQPAGRIEADIGGRIAEFASALVAVDHLARLEPGKAEHLVAPRCGPGRARRGSGLRTSPPVVPELGTISTAKPRRSPAAARYSGDPVRLMPKWKSKPIVTPPTASCPTRMRLDECLGPEPGQRGVEAQHDHPVETGRGQEPQLVARVGQAEQRLLRLEKARGCGSKVNAAAGRPSSSARAARGRDHRLMTPVHPVEIADGHHGAAQRVARGRLRVHHGERIGRFRLFCHGLVVTFRAAGIQPAGKGAAKCQSA